MRHLVMAGCRLRWFYLLFSYTFFFAFLGVKNLFSDYALVLRSTATAAILIL